MSALNTTQYFQEPTHDEIAMSAFLAWEKDGRPADRELHYWLTAEGPLRALRLKKAEAVVKATAKIPMPKPAKLATTAKPETSTTTAGKTLTSATPAKRQMRPTTSAARR